MDRETCPILTADTLFSSCKNETNVKMRKIHVEQDSEVRASESDWMNPPNSGAPGWLPRLSQLLAKNLAHSKCLVNISFYYSKSFGAGKGNQDYFSKPEQEVKKTQLSKQHQNLTPKVHATKEEIDKLDNTKINNSVLQKTSSTK